MKDGLTNEGKLYGMYLCEDNVLIDQYPVPGLDEYWYHIFRFANDGDPVFSNPKEQSIVRLKKCKDGAWWRTSSTDHYAEFDTEISEEEAMKILNSGTANQALDKVRRAVKSSRHWRELQIVRAKSGPPKRPALLYKSSSYFCARIRLR